MKIASALLAVSLSVTALAQTEPATPTPARDVSITSTAPASSSAPALSPQVQAIRDAKDPSAAINAYAQAITWANGRADDVVAAEDTFVHQMIEFGLPEMAEVQAQDLLSRQPGNGAAWAVAAHLAAKRNDPNAALSQIATAVDRAPSDPFVLRTAGQILAWYDSRANQSQVTAPVKNAIARLREPLRAQQMFVEAYDRATDFYKNQEQQPTPTGQAAAPAENNATAQSTDQQPQPSPEPQTYISRGYDTGDNTTGQYSSGGYTGDYSYGPAYDSGYSYQPYSSYTYNYYYPSYDYGYGYPYWYPDYGYSYLSFGYGYHHHYPYWYPSRRDFFFRDRPIAPRYWDGDIDHRRSLSQRDPVMRDRFNNFDGRSGRFYDAGSTGSSSGSSFRQRLENGTSGRTAPSDSSTNSRVDSMPSSRHPTVREASPSSGRDRFAAPRSGSSTSGRERTSDERVQRAPRNSDSGGETSARQSRAATPAAKPDSGRNASSERGGRSSSDSGSSSSGRSRFAGPDAPAAAPSPPPQRSNGGSSSGGSSSRSGSGGSSGGSSSRGGGGGQSSSDNNRSHR